MLKLLSSYKSFGGNVEFYSHPSRFTKTEMRFSVFVPTHAGTRKVPVLYWLSGLTCTEENFMIKAGAQRYAAEHGILLVAPDTSPRGEGIPGKGEGWDLGQGAGFYVNATEAPWSEHFQMYDYVSIELPEIIHSNFSVMPDRQSVFGHSMGGHGALVLALREPGKYLSVSAFAPICAPSLVPWGQKAFTAYLGADKKTWEEYDANILVTRTKFKSPILVDQGTEDQFLKVSLWPDVFEKTCAKISYPLHLRYQKGYDHSYYFIASFIKDHIEFHSKVLNNT